MDVEANDQIQIMRGKRSKRSRLSITATSSSTSGGSYSEEDEDMANCLIMLAQSGGRFQKPKIMVEKPEFHVYECKTCNRSFSSFQALGGHRASHKKHKLDQEKQVVICNDLSDEGSQLVSLRKLNLKVHECSICGLEFASGQALGGHMRRHRTSNSTTSINSPTDTVNSDENTRNVLQLDLNLPAPEEHHLDSKFQLLCSSPVPALVGCHY